MANIEITNIDNASVEIRDGVHQDDTLTDPAAAKTYLEGTIMARDSVSLKLVPFVKGGTTNEDGIPKAVLTYEIVEPAGGADIPCRVLTSGVVNRDRLVIDADGDASNIDAAVEDALRAYSIVPIPVQQLAELDNQ